MKNEKTHNMNLALPLGYLMMVCCCAYFHSISSDLSFMGALSQQLASNLVGGLLLFGICFWGSCSRMRFVRLGAESMAVVVLIVLTIDSYLLVTIDARFTIDNVIAFAGELPVIISFMFKDKLAIILLAVICVSAMLRDPMSRLSHLFKCNGFVSRFIIVTFIVFISVVCGGAKTAGKDVFSANYSAVRELYRSKYDAADVSSDELYLRKMYPDALPKLIDLTSWAEKKNNVILLIVESLSSVDSMKMSGIQDYLPGLDEVSSEGMLFENFLANYLDTDGAKATIFHARPLIPYPGTPSKPYDAFKEFDSIPKALKRIGYRSEYITTGPLSFLSQGEYLSYIGFDKEDGALTVDRFCKARKFAFGCAADDELYSEAIDRIKGYDSSNPFFLSLLTVTGHEPMLDPEGVSNDEERVQDKNLPKVEFSSFFTTIMYL